jgi:hypothetical protein
MVSYRWDFSSNGLAVLTAFLFLNSANNSNRNRFISKLPESTMCVVVISKKVKRE